MPAAAAGALRQLLLKLHSRFITWKVSLIVKHRIIT